MVVGGGVCKVIFMSNPTVVLRLGWGFDNCSSLAGPWKCTGPYIGPYIGLESAARPFPRASFPLIKGTVYQNDQTLPRRPWSQGTNIQGTVVQGDFGPRRLLSKEAFTSDKLAQLFFFNLLDITTLIFASGDKRNAPKTWCT